jgi:hypothetical protein
MIKKIAVVLLLSVTANVGNADCLYRGKGYPEGTVIGPYICKDGQWVRK